MKRIFLPLLLAFALVLSLSGCTEETKIENVKKTVLPDCKNKTVNDLVNGLLEKPTWGFEKGTDGSEAVTVKGTIAGDKMPAWVKDQKLMDITFRFPLDQKKGEYDPSNLDGFPSFTTPEGLLQGFKAITCS